MPGLTEDGADVPDVDRAREIFCADNARNRPCCVRLTANTLDLLSSDGRANYGESAIVKSSGE